MKLINSYLSKNIIYPVVSIIVMLSSIILITQSLKYINMMVSHGISGEDFIYLSSLLLPSLLFVIIPICLFIAVIYSLNKLGSYRELNILKGFGVSNLTLSKPILIIAIISMLFHYFISLYLMPVVNHEFKNLTNKLKDQYITFFLQEKVFSHPAENFTIYIEEKIGKNKFKNIFFQDTTDDVPVTIIAEKGELINKDNKVFFNLVKGNRQEINKQGELITLYFDALLWRIRSNNYIDQYRRITIQEKSLLELLFPKESLDLSLKKKMLSEANHRIIWPIYNLILTMIALTALLCGEFSRSGKTKRIIIFSIIGAIVIIISNGLVSLSSNYTEVIIANYLFAFFMLSGLSYNLFYKEN